jgi:hypothetical protein
MLRKYQYQQHSQQQHQQQTQHPAVRLLPLRLAVLLLLLLLLMPRNSATEMPCSSSSLTSAKWIRFSNTLSGTSTSADNATGSALPNQRLDLDFHLSSTRTSATAHRSFRLRRMPRFTPRSALSIRQRIVAHAVVLSHNSTHGSYR